MHACMHSQQVSLHPVQWHLATCQINNTNNTTEMHINMIGPLNWFSRSGPHLATLSATWQDSAWSPPHCWGRGDPTPQNNYDNGLRWIPLSATTATSLNPLFRNGPQIIKNLFFSNSGVSHSILLSSILYYL